MAGGPIRWHSGGQPILGTRGRLSINHKTFHLESKNCERQRTTLSESSVHPIMVKAADASDIRLYTFFSAKD